MKPRARPKLVRRRKGSEAPQLPIDRPALLAFSALFILTAIVFAQNASHSFLTYDDPEFVTDNAFVRRGLDAESVRWAFTSAARGWYPLTWLSHMLDVELWGMRAGAHLLSNALLHAITACLLFVAARRLGKWAGGGGGEATAAAAFVAAAFAVHPMHVESVAWVSERKDTLSTLFAVAALLLYAFNPQKVWRVALAMALSLASKQMYVTLPFVLLLLDYWPLGRMKTPEELRRCMLEKWPLFVVTAIGIRIAFITQQNLNAMQATTAIPLLARVENAATAYLFYLEKQFVPTGLAVPYPLADISTRQAFLAAALIVAITVAVIELRTRAPYLITGWFWFAGTLVPVIGIVAIGTQSKADRYSYFPSIGIFIAIAFGANALWRHWSARHPERGRRLAITLAATGALVIVAFTATAHRQSGYWKDTETLFERAVAVTPPNPLAEFSLGQEIEARRPADAVAHLQRSIDIAERQWGSRGLEPDWLASAHVGLGTARLNLALQRPPGERATLIEQAIADFRNAVALGGSGGKLANNLAVAYRMKGEETAKTTNGR